MDLRTPHPPKSQALRFQDPGRAPGRGADPPQAAASPALPAVAGGHAGFRGRCAANRDGVDQSPPCACSASHLRGRARRRRDAALGGPPPRSLYGRHAPLAPEHSDGWATELTRDYRTFLFLCADSTDNPKPGGRATEARYFTVLGLGFFSGASLQDAHRLACFRTPSQSALTPVKVHKVEFPGLMPVSQVRRGSSNCWVP